MLKLNDLAKNYIGVNEGTTEHHNIIDTYNTINPLPRGYAVSYDDSWCMVFVSVMAKLDNINNFPFECSVPNVYNQFLTNGLITFKPKAGDLIFYSWGRGNGSSPDHIGIIDKVDNNLITTIEGNYSDSVKQRTININDDCILGFGDMSYYYNNVNYDDMTIHELAIKTIRGDFGVGADRVNALGDKYNAVQKEVNKILNS